MKGMLQIEGKACAKAQRQQSQYKAHKENCRKIQPGRAISGSERITEAIEIGLKTLTPQHDFYHCRMAQH